MNTDKGQRADHILLGDSTFWFCGRAWQIGLSAVFIWFVASPISGPGFGLTDLFLVLLLVIFNLGMDGLIYGSADDNGLSYRRYVGLTTVSWNNVVGVEWSLTKIVFRLRSARSWRNRLVFDLNPSLTEAIRGLWKKASEPEEVQALREILSQRTEQIPVQPARVKDKRF